MSPKFPNLLPNSIDFHQSKLSQVYCVGSQNLFPVYELVIFYLIDLKIQQLDYYIPRHLSLIIHHWWLLKGVFSFLVDTESSQIFY